MKATWRTSGAALLLALVACDSAPDAAPPAGDGIAAESDYKARIDALPEARRNAVFLRAVRDAGHDCQGVIGSAYNGEQFGMPSWAARCRDGADWLIMLGNDGRAHVARREEKPAP
jgi:hypothetical protein